VWYMHLIRILPPSYHLVGVVKGLLQWFLVNFETFQTFFFTICINKTWQVMSKKKKKEKKRSDSVCLFKMRQKSQRKAEVIMLLS
jgi:hypothetical protein